MKKVLVLCTLVLAVALTLIAFAIPGAAADTYTGTYGTMTWTIDVQKGEMTIVGSGDMPGSSNSNAFALADELRSSIKTVKIDDRITNIGNNLFNGFNGLESITLPSSLTYIGQKAFYGCSALTTITIPSGVFGIGTQAFYGCERLVDVVNLSNLTLELGNTNNGYLAYYAKSVAAASRLQQVGDFVFLTVNDNTYLTDYVGTASEVTLPERYNGLTYHLYKYAFLNSTTVTSVTLPSWVREIPEGMFAGCTALKTTGMEDQEDQVTHIGDYAYKGCMALTETGLHENVLAIGERAYSGCTSLTEFYLPRSLMHIGSYVFENCTGLTEIDWPKYLNVVPEGIFAGCKEILNINLTPQLLSLQSYAFRGCEKLQSITLPMGFEEIGDGAFMECWGLKDIYIPESVTFIGAGAFSKTGLREITIPSSITVLSNNMFYCCYGLENVYLPEGMVEIGNNAFFSCSSMTSIELPSTVTTLGANAFYSCNGFTSFRLPRSVTTLGNGVFGYCGNLQEVTLHTGITEIPVNMFQGCTLLRSVYGIELITSIGNQAFDGCTALSEITLPTSLASIGAYAFQDCTALTTLSLPAGITELGSYALNRCSNFEKLTYCGTEEAWASVTKGNGWSGYATKYNLTFHLYENDCDEECDLCWEIREAPHAYENACDDYCDSCGSYRSVGDHAYDDDCDEFCNECNAQREVSHNYQNDCDASCDSCGAIRDVAGHWYDHDCDPDCNNCGEIRSVTHQYDDVCDPDCNNCWETRTPPHNYVDGYCDLCKAEDPSYESIKYFYFEELSDGTYSVAAGEALWNDPSVTEIVIPSEYNGKAVTMIADNGFYYYQGVVSVIIPESVTSIGMFAFSYCPSLSTVIFLGNTLESIGQSAFEECAMLDTITLPDSLKDLGSMAFKNCMALQSIDIPSGVDTIWMETFYGCTMLTAVYLPEGLKAIDEYAFACSGCEAWELPDSLESIGAYAFYQCSFQGPLTIPESVTYFGAGAFAGIYGLGEIYYDGTLEQWCAIEFYDCESNPLYYAGVLYYQGQNITNRLYIAADLEIGENVLPYLKNVEEIFFGGSIWDWESKYFSSPNDWLKAGYATVYFYSDTEPEQEGNFWHYGTDGESIAVWPAFVEDPYFTYKLLDDDTYAIYAKDVYNLPYELIIPSTYKNKPITMVGGFGDGMFTSVVIPEGVKVIESAAFRWCAQLTFVTLPESLEKIEDSAFAACQSLTSIRLPSENLYYIGEWVFASSYNLANIIWCDADEKWMGVEKAEGWNYDMGEYTFHYHFYGDDNTCDCCEYELSGIYAVNIALGQDIIVKYYAIVPNAQGTLTMKFTMNGKTVTVEGKSTGKSDEYVFEFAGIAPQCMQDVIDAVLYDGEIEKYTKDGFTVLSYLNKIIDGSNYSDSARELAKATMNYGAAAQLYTGHNADNIVTDPSASVNMIPMDTDMYLENGEGVTFTAASVYFDNVNRIRVKFKTENIDALTILINGEVAEWTDNGDGTYSVMTDAIYATALGDAFTFEAQVDGNTVSILSYSVHSYIISKAQSSNSKLVALVQALYDYGIAATYVNNG